MRAVKQNLEIDLDNYSQKYVNRLSTGCIVRKVFGFDWNATLCEGSVGAVGSQYVKMFQSPHSLLRLIMQKQSRLNSPLLRVEASQW